MTREEAIIFGKTILMFTNKELESDKHTYEFTTMAIEALSAEPCEDCISRAELIDKTIKRNSIWLKITDSRGMNLQEIIDELPNVQPIRPKGKWIQHPYSIEWKSDASCSNCGRLVAGAFETYVTCPYCSADMR